MKNIVDKLLGIGMAMERRVWKEIGKMSQASAGKYYPSEAMIATIKHPRYGFNKPRTKASQGCILKGQAAIFGANLAHLTRDWMAAMA